MAYSDIMVTEDNRELYDNLYEVYDYFPTKDEFEVEDDEWIWTLKCTDGDGDWYHWQVTCAFVSGSPASVELALVREYFGRLDKNVSDRVITLSCEVDGNEIPSDYDNICWELIEELREIFNEYE